MHLFFGQAEPAALLLAVDVSATALKGGHLEFATQQILQMLNSLNRSDKQTQQYLYCQQHPLDQQLGKKTLLLFSFPSSSQDSETWSDVRVGVMTYDSQVHLYDLNPTLTRPHMLIITETDDLQLPVRDGLLVPLRDCLHNVERLDLLTDSLNS